MVAFWVMVHKHSALKIPAVSNYEVKNWLNYFWCLNNNPLLRISVLCGSRRDSSALSTGKHSPPSNRSLKYMHVKSVFRAATHICILLKLFYEAIWVSLWTFCYLMCTVTDGDNAKKNPHLFTASLDLKARIKIGTKTTFSSPKNKTKQISQKRGSAKP